MVRGRGSKDLKYSFEEERSGEGKRERKGGGRRERERRDGWGVDFGMFLPTNQTNTNKQILSIQSAADVSSSYTCPFLSLPVNDAMKETSPLQVKQG